MSRMPSRQIAANRRSFHRCTQGGDGGRANADSSSNHSAPASFGTSRAAVAIGPASAAGTAPKPLAVRTASPRLCSHGFAPIGLSALTPEARDEDAKHVVTPGSAKPRPPRIEIRNRITQPDTESHCRTREILRHLEHLARVKRIVRPTRTARRWPGIAMRAMHFHRLPVRDGPGKRGDQPTAEPHFLRCNQPPTPAEPVRISVENVLHSAHPGGASPISSSQARMPSSSLAVTLSSGPTVTLPDQRQPAASRAAHAGRS